MAVIQMRTLTHLDLFSGIGGFSIAAQNCGYTTVGFCEKEPYAQQTLKERFGAVLADAAGQQDNGERRDCKRGRDAVGRTQQTARSRNGEADNDRACGRHPVLHDNIFTLDGSDYAGVDLLTGGFPCQPFSVAGKRLGKEDDRALWPEMLRVINGANPRWIIGENVAGIVTMELDNILSDLEGIGYSAWPLVIPACAVDARHRRDRVWIIARRSLGDSSSKGLSQRGRSERDTRNTEEGAGMVAEPERSGEDVAHANSQRGRLREAHRTDAGDAGESPATWKDERDWFSESGMGRVAHGIPDRAHRLRGLGNAIVPQVAEEIIRAIRSVEESQSI